MSKSADGIVGKSSVKKNRLLMEAISRDAFQEDQRDVEDGITITGPEEDGPETDLALLE